MADFGLGSFSTTARSLIGSESGFIDRDGTLYITGADAIVATTGTNWVSNHGFIYAYGGGFSGIDADGSVFELLNGKDGVIDAENPTGGTLDLNLSTLAQIVNHGTIHSSSGDAIDFLDSDGAATFNLINTGLITSNDNNTIDVDVGTGLWEIFNSGTIVGTDDVVELTADVGDTGINYITNTGTITATTGDAVIFFAGDASTVRFSNSGEITAASEAVYTSRNSDVILDNSGLLATNSNFRAVDLDDGNDIFRNTGEVIGDVDLGGGNDFFDNNGGVVNGFIDGEIGNDTLLGGNSSDDMAGGAGDDTVIGRGGDDLLDGDSGNDIILGGEGNDGIDGGVDNDTLNGNGGDDTILGGSGNDILVGQDGSDELEGGSGNDTMDGGNGDDVLEGDEDNDILRGRAGEDELAGGLGFDLLTGGQDADLFVFRSTAETAVGALRDQILDFEQGLDLIVVAGLSPGVFEFRGTAGFAPSGNPELRLIETATGSTIVQLDSNGDGAADSEIRVANVTGLTADDFVL
ncbi:calcium-binding protein [Antarctobacter jejuensis]|uniref:calcium-binding protein n=1 Tax=Antarctobacter jejuensis TaxID=1439938 RepID=UPI003FD48FA4